MKIFIGYPPTVTRFKGTPLLSQNRQYQVFHVHTTLFPVVLGTAATMLRDKKHEVTWVDCIAEKINTEDFYKLVEEKKPDIFFFETKAPVVKLHWEIINEIKEKFPNLKICVMGDHVSAVDLTLGLQKEFMEKCKVDYIINGGYFDFAMCELVEALEKNKKIPVGIWYKDKKGKIIENGRYNFTGNLDDAPIIDRKLTKNHLYQHEFNLIGRPLAYIMAGRDCWYGKCTFCFHPDTNIMTKGGIKEIKDIKLGEEILTHKGNYQKSNFIFQRYYSGDLINIKTHNLPEMLKCTPNHKLFAIKKDQSEAQLIEAEKLEKGDFLTFPIIREVIDIKELNIYNIIKENFIEIPTNVKTLNSNLVQSIFELRRNDFSTREIASELKINRGTVLEYLHNETKGKITLEENKSNVKFKYGKTSIPKKIKLDKFFLRLVGYYLADGNASFYTDRPNSGTLQFTFNKNETEYISEVAIGIKKYFNLEASLIENPANNTVQVTVFSNVLAYLFKTLFGEDCLEKKIPENFMKLPLEKQKELINGLFRGDGHLRPEERSPELILNTTSKQLVYSTWRILTRFNAIHSFYISKKEIREKAKHDQYVLALNCESIKKINIVDVSERNSRGNKYVKIKEDLILFPIKEIKKEEYYGDVYNISVENEHSYTANLVGVANCVWDTNLYPKGTFKGRSPENVMKEVKYLVDEIGVKEIFDDAGTIIVGPWLKKFCNLMIESGYNKKVIYSGNMRFGAATADDYKLMKQAGFRLLKYGLESGCQSTINKLDKGTKIEDVEKSCREAKAAGLVTHLTCMVGYSWETREDGLKTYKLAKRLMLKGLIDVLQSTVMIPYPGTPLYKEGMEKNWFLFDPKDYERFDMREPVFKTPDMTPDQVTKLCNKVYHIFIDPRYVLRHLRKIKNFEDVKYTLRGVKAVAGHLMDFNRSAAPKAEESPIR